MIALLINIEISKYFNYTRKIHKKKDNSPLPIVLFFTFINKNFSLLISQEFCKQNRLLT
jgi:hypothetical protein